MPLFQQESIRLALSPGNHGELIFWPNWFGQQRADKCLELAQSSIPWQSDCILIAGKTIPLPRLHCWFSAPTGHYEWSGIPMTARAFPPWLDQIRLDVEQETGAAFNSCLTNYYRSGKDSVDWHADDEAILGQAPIIASITLGEERTFQMKHRLSGQRYNLGLPHGSLLLMGSGIQQYWHHRLPKTRHRVKPRINFTFRYVDIV